MNEHIEIDITRTNPEIDPHLHVWGWEIPAYLFLGGLTAGLLILSGIFYLMRKDRDMPFTVYIAPILAPPILALGMLFLLLDLSHKMYVWRLYLTFQLTSPMSWGAWALILIFPSSILFGLIQLRDEYRDSFLKWIREFGFLNKVMNMIANILEWAFKKADYLRPHNYIFAYINIIMGAFIGIYTGILLSSFISRPFWNTPVLGFLFLSSGISAASALIMMFTKNHNEEQTMLRIDASFLVLELFLLSQIFIGFFTQSAYHNQAAYMVFGGPYTGLFWMLIVLQGILFPLFLEVMELLRGFRYKIMTPLWVLFGGILLRIIFVYLGQMSEVGLHL